jgi:hypothetical protein
VAALFRASAIPAIRGAVPLVGMPEPQVSLPGGDAASQTDLFVLASGEGKRISIAVEGKAEDSFAEPLGTWLSGASAGKVERLSYLKSVLGLSGELSKEIGYQLLHRAASAVIEANRFSAPFAVLIVHSLQRKSLFPTRPRTVHWPLRRNLRIRSPGRGRESEWRLLPGWVGAGGGEHGPC